MNFVFPLKCKFQPGFAVENRGENTSESLVFTNGMKTNSRWEMKHMLVDISKIITSFED